MKSDYPFYGIEMDFQPCPKCNIAPIPILSGGWSNIQVKVICIQCGLHTQTFKEPKAVKTYDRIGDGNDEIRRRLYEKAVNSWNAGEFQRVIEDIDLDVAGLEQVIEMIQNYLEAQDELTPGARVLGWNLIIVKIKGCGKLTRKEVEYGTSDLL